MPKGAAEFIDIDIARCLERKVRYVVMSLNSFTQQPYCDLPECFAGWMARERAPSTSTPRLLVENGYRLVRNVRPRPTKTNEWRGGFVMTASDPSMFGNAASLALAPGGLAAPARIGPPGCGFASRLDGQTDANLTQPRTISSFKVNHVSGCRRNNRLITICCRISAP